MDRVIEEKLDTIHEEVTEARDHIKWTNGRVADVQRRTTELERIVTGDPRPGRDDRGLVGVADDVQQVLPTVNGLITTLRWAGMTFVGAVLVGLANLLVYFLFVA